MKQVSCKADRVRAARRREVLRIFAAALIVCLAIAVMAAMEK